MFIQQHNFGTELVIRCGHTDGVHNSGDHLHQFCELEMVLEGEIEITVDGKTYTARAGDIAVISPFRMHAFHTPKYVKQLICVFSNAFISDFLPIAELCKDREAYVFHASEPLWSYLVGSGFQDTRTKLVFDENKDHDYIHKLRSTFYLIISEFFNTVPVMSSSSIDNTLAKILIYMSENYEKDLKLTTVGAALGYSPKYVSNCLRAIPGHGFRSLLNSIRIEHAKIALVNTDKNNLEIAYDCGFVSESSFHRAFLDNVGIPPKRYRQKHKSFPTSVASARDNTSK